MTKITEKLYYFGRKKLSFRYCLYLKPVPISN